MHGRIVPGTILVFDECLYLYHLAPGRIPCLERVLQMARMAKRVYLAFSLATKYAVVQVTGTNVKLILA